MSFQADVFRVLVASPSDLKEEREVVVKTIHKWNSLNAHEEKKVLLPMMWEKHSAPLLGNDPQKIINRQFADSCDIGIALFWTSTQSIL